MNKKTSIIQSETSIIETSIIKSETSGIKRVSVIIES